MHSRMWRVMVAMLMALMVIGAISVSLNVMTVRAATNNRSVLRCNPIGRWRQHRTRTPP